MPLHEIAPGVACLPLGVANVYFVGEPGQLWVLVDTGTPGNEGKIQAAALSRYGTLARPRAILLTHGHPDHAGSVLALADAWDVPIYAHEREMPFVTGHSLYPPADPTVGGAMAFLSRLFPSKLLDLGRRIQPLPPDGTVPGLPGWEWQAAPGHSPGHAAFWRASDRTLLAGDAFTTVNLDSLADLVRQKPEICRPPAMVTCDWNAARASAERLAGLRPFALACGHGVPLSGADIAGRLERFVQGFPLPAHGRYIPTPAVTDRNGIVSLPPPPPDPLPARLALGLGAAALAVFAVRRCRQNRPSREAE